MKLLSLLTALTLIADPDGLAQQPSAAESLRQINRDVWKPFLEGIAKNEESLYRNVHSTAYVRIQADARLILNYETYVDDTRNMMRRYQDSGRKLTMELRFEERITDGRFASERGITKVAFFGPQGQERVFYGSFHTILRKEGDVWKILTDYAPAGVRVGELEFSKGREMGDVEPFGCYMPYPEKKLHCEN